MGGRHALSSDILRSSVSTVQCKTGCSMSLPEYIHVWSRMGDAGSLQAKLMSLCENPVHLTDKATFVKPWSLPRSHPLWLATKTPFWSELYAGSLVAWPTSRYVFELWIPLIPVWQMNQWNMFKVQSFGLECNSWTVWPQVMAGIGRSPMFIDLLGRPSHPMIMSSCTRLQMGSLSKEPF
ncbi:uncharacterized protein BDZ83DRAFT_648972 [Colletotrichum acutatum]|uniref:Uncharacterized protein n=1 Tax=Glomerella acutata TaxID=27357 RepID=A0AAD8UTD2_GLOAC|nr:uncharacterized protein BDZ83DRAFT_648972 [Colletotrichum acutatum]KAK1728120.1 hypothetical protein BDZ83DRAFT_648972 [Colletotrichum acutatum]